MAWRMGWAARATPIATAAGKVVGAFALYHDSLPRPRRSI
jgi:hypothetical protein